MTVREAWATMLHADQEYLDQREHWRRLAADEDRPWDDPEIVAATKVLEQLGHQSNAAHEMFDEALAEVTFGANPGRAA